MHVSLYTTVLLCLSVPPGKYQNIICVLPVSSHKRNFDRLWNREINIYISSFVITNNFFLHCGISNEYDLHIFIEIWPLMINHKLLKIVETNSWLFTMWCVLHCNTECVQGRCLKFKFCYSVQSFFFYFIRRVYKVHWRTIGKFTPVLTAMWQNNKAAIGRYSTFYGCV